MYDCTDACILNTYLSHLFYESILIDSQIWIVSMAGYWLPATLLLEEQTIIKAKTLFEKCFFSFTSK